MIWMQARRNSPQLLSLPHHSIQIKNAEVVKMENDLSVETIQKLFMKQVIALTHKTNKLQSFDYQFSDRWL